MNDNVLLLAALGLLLHIILKYTTEAGTFVENFWSARTLRYAAIALVSVAVTVLLDHQMTGAGAFAVGFAGGSIVAMTQKAVGDNSPSSKRAKAMIRK